MSMSTPLHTLYEHVQRFLPALFVFVARPETHAHNGLAERSMRPLVIAREISARLSLASLVAGLLRPQPFLPVLS